MGIVTKTGDGGETDLIGGVRVSKADLRVACCGDVDELNAALGLARSLSPCPDARRRVLAIQERLFALAAELAGGTPGEEIGQGDVDFLEETVERCMGRAPALTGFAVPGADPASAALHMARTVCRRLERELVGAVEAGVAVRPVLLRYANRMSDALFALAWHRECKEKGTMS